MYVKSDTQLLADVFENFRNMCLEIFELHSDHFFTASGLAWQTVLKNTKVKLDLLTDISMLLIVENGIRGRICLAIRRYSEANKKYMNDYDENKELSGITYWDVNNLNGWEMPQ